MVVRERLVLAGLAVAAGLFAGPSAAAADVAFSDQTAAAGLNHTTSILFDMSARQMFCGGSVGDFNRDGWPDLFLLGGGGTADALYLNNGDGTFTDRAAAWGVAAVHRGHGTTVGDFNNDGWPDIYITSAGLPASGDVVGKNILYRNNGNSTFTNVAVAAGVNRTSAVYYVSTGAAFGDYDLDGDLDLAVSGWVGSDSNRLFRNDGDQTFTDVTLSAGVGHPYYGFSPRFVDMDGDRYPELLIAADYNTSHYYVNNQDGSFTNATNGSGTNMDDHGMGATVADFNRDGLPDWYVTSIYADTTDQDGNYLYVNQGNHQYVALAEAAGSRNGGWGWGVDAMDFDHDGFIDLVETNGWFTPEWEFENSYLFRNNGDLTFSESQGGASGFDHVSQGRTVLLLDYDRDGDMDIALTGWDEPLKLFRNDVSGADANWIEVLLDTSGNSALAPDGYGAKVRATTGSVAQYYWINGGSTYLGRSQPVAHFGLGSALRVDLSVEWPDGSVTSLDDLPANQIVTLGPPLAGAPGEASSGDTPGRQLLAGYNRASGMVDVSYASACGSTNNTIYYGDLADVATHGYSGAACWLGNSGFAAFDPAGLSNAFFLIVGNTGTVEGSYGLQGAGLERPEHTGTAECDLPQDLAGACDPP